MVDGTTLRASLQSLTAEGSLYIRHSDRSLTCVACGHRCLIKPSRDGICKVRFNEDGYLRVPYNYVAALQCDPTEKKPFFHVMPGSLAVTFGMLGCDFHCAYCQNWMTSQSLRDPKAVAGPRRITPQDIIRLGKRAGARLIVSSYNEPLITSEWAKQIFTEAKLEGFITGYVSNGNATDEVLDFIKPFTDLYKIDLKTMNDKNYRKLGGVLSNVLQTIERVYERGFWLEVVTLVIPDYNATSAELKAIAKFLANISPDIPWHVTGFHSDYKMAAHKSTGSDLLVHAAEIGHDAGLRYVYAGNRPGQTGKYESTYCPNCNKKLIERSGFHILKNNLIDGSCPACRTMIPGIWSYSDLNGLP